MFESVKEILKESKSKYSPAYIESLRLKVKEINLVLDILSQIEKGGFKYSKEKHESGKQIIISLTYYKS